MPDVTVAAGEVSSGEVVLAANTVSTVTFTDNIGAVTLVNTGSAMVWFTTDGGTPTVGGRNSRPLPAGSVDDGRATTNTASGDVVKLISSGTPTVIVASA